MRIIGISCINYNRAIGYKNKLIYTIKTDMDFFRQTTLFTANKNKKNAVLMGSKTYLSIADKYRPLENRLNLIITNNNYSEINHIDNYLFSNVEDALDFSLANNNIESLYIIGGELIYNYFYKKKLYSKILLNEIKYPKTNIGDKYFPKICENNYLKSTKTTVKDGQFVYDVNEYINIIPYTHKIRDTDENQYLLQLKNVLETGELRETRNSKTISKFGIHMEFDISNKFPLLTTKKIFWKGIVEELIWFINGDTDSKNLEKRGVNIWKGNSSTEFLNKLNLDYNEGTCGPVYGFQWRHFNADYQSSDTDYKNKGIDQLLNCINLIKTDPYSRRIFMTAWNPCQLDKMVLPPCHVSYQFYVTNDNKLDCIMYQRSGDMFLGIPFNIASTALLTNIIAKMTDYKPGKIKITIGDAHIYSEHIPQVNQQLNRIPYPLPELKIETKYINIEDYKSSDFLLKYYNPHDTIKATMVI